MKAFSNRTKAIVIAFAAVVLIAAGLFCLLFCMNISPTEKAAKKTAKYIVKNTKQTFGNEWAATALSRGDYSCARAWLKKYKAEIKNEVKNKAGILSENAVTVYSRSIIACLAINENPKSLEGYDITEALRDTEKVMSRGINGGIFALIALDASGEDKELSEKYVSMILKAQHESGAFGLSKAAPDVDVTAMALQALAPYANRQAVKTAVEKALNALSAVQKQSGEFASMGVANSQSLSQVILALDALKIPLDDTRFVKNGNTLISVLMSYKRDDGGFARTLDEKESMLSATLQVLMALTAINSERDIYFRECN